MVELFDFRKRNIDLRFFAVPPLGDKLWQAVQRLWAEHDIDVRRTPHDGLAFLTGDAATDADDEIGLGLLERAHAAEVVENTLLGFFAHRASVEQDDVSLFGRIGSDDGFGCGEHVSHFVRIVLVHLAPESADEQLFGHAGQFWRIAAISAGGRIHTR